MERVSISKLKEGITLSLGECSLSEKEIISYAKEFDPLPFHVDKKAGEESMFRGLIASGPQIFHKVHKEEWLPKFGHSVVCGVGVNNWKFLQPLYPNEMVYSQVTIKEITAKKRKNISSINWFYEFLDKYKTPIQSLEMTVLHNVE